jgi:hypothetical protein
VAGGVQATQLRHGNVEHDDVGLQPCRGFQKRVSIANRTYDLAAGFQNVLQRIHQHPVVIRLKYSRAI